MNNEKENVWQFSSIPNIEEANFDKMLEKFFQMKINGLVRENIQNSLDGKRRDSDQPVIVRIKTGDIYVDEIPGIQEIKQRISHLQGRNSYTKETIQYMQKQVKQEKVRYISFEDMNTKGLSGAKNGQSNSPEDTWSAYAYNKGVHSEENEQEEKIRGGSHGVGKIASNAASDVHVSFFANCDAHGDQHLGGTIQLIEHTYRDQCYRSTGYFAKSVGLGSNKTRFYPFENKFHQVFQKETRGLKIIIPFLRREFDNEKEIIKSVISSFFVGILNEKLEVEVNGKIISKETLHNYVEDPGYYVQEVKEAKKEFTPLYVKTYENTQSQKLTITNFGKEYHFDLYFRYDNEIPKGRMAIVRTVGMKIEDFKVTGHATKPYNAVLIGGIEEDNYLKSLENESHTALSYDHIKDKDLQKEAKKFISRLSKEIGGIIKDMYEKNNPVDGAMNTEDILYTVENKFKKDLSKTAGSVMVNKKNPLIKTSAGTPKNKRQNRKRNPRDPVEIDNETKKRKPRKMVTNHPEGESGITSDSQEKPSTKFSLYPENVERAIMGDMEFVRFDFSSDEELKKHSQCEIAMAVVDGMGQEYVNEFNLTDNYEQVIDRATNQVCPIKNNKIKSVTINDGVVQLQMSLYPRYNQALKFIYYIEV